MAEAVTKDKGRFDELAGKYLTFNIGAEVYGISIMQVKEIIGAANQEIHEVPRMPDFAKGVVNLRDHVIPVVSLRLRFGLEEIEVTDRTCIVVTEVTSESGHHVLMGLVVDSVYEVLQVASEEIEPPPSFGATLDAAYLLGIAKVKKSVNILLDIDKVLAAEELKAVTAAAS